MDQLKSTISRLITDATCKDAEGIRSDLNDRYLGEKYGDEKRGKSQFVSTDVSDAIEAILPDIMDVFTSSEDIVEFDPEGQEDEEAAKQETSVVSHLFWQKNRGFENLYVWFKEALISQNSYVRFGWEDKERVTIEDYEDLTEDELVAVISQIDGDVEPLDQEIDEDTGLINVKLRIVNKSKKYVIEAIPQEEFFITPRWNKVGLDGVPCCGHHREMTRGELTAMGFSKNSIDRAFDDSDDEQEQARHDTEDHFESESDEGDGPTQKVRVYEAYLWADQNDDGVPELLQVWAVGDGSTVMEWEDGGEAIEEVSGLPFAALTPYIMPHRHVGRSVAELVDDIQKIKTILMRTTLDNIYATQYGRPVVNEDKATENTYNDIVNPAHGSPIRYGDDGLNFYVPPSIAGATLPLLDVFEGVKEQRTGATRYNQGLDAESLNKTATGIQQIMNASQKKTKLIARTFAETGLRDLFLGIHRDLRAGPMKEIAIKLKGEWVQVNPRLWKDRTDMTVNVGMGRGDRDEKRQFYMLMGQTQEKLLMGKSRMVDESKLFATAERMAETYGVESIEPFLNDPSRLPPPQPEPQQPDPAMQMAAAQIQNMQQETANRASKDQAEIALKSRELDIRERELAVKEAEARGKAIKSAADVQTNMQKLELERDKEINADDRFRDELAMDAVTGALDREAQEFKSTPAVPYDEFGE
ncbi:MAG: portal protein [Pikeienuella sp.]